MDTFLVVYRLVAIAIIAAWGVSLYGTRGKPSDWTAPVVARYRVVCLVGIAAGFAVLAYSLVLPT